MLGSWKGYLQARLFQKLVWTLLAQLLLKVVWAGAASFRASHCWCMARNHREPDGEMARRSAPSTHMHMHLLFLLELILREGSPWAQLVSGAWAGSTGSRQESLPWRDWCGCMFHPSNCGIVHSWFIRKQASCCGFSKNTSLTVLFRADSVFEPWSWTAPEMAVWMV